jgi:predicted RNase H-like nuclease (RuvC/YqgF family)
LHLIVGVDPGTTTGLASVDFTGKVIDLFSSKDLGLDRALERLVSLGSVSVIATDVAPVPGFVQKMASKLGAVVYAPPESTLVLDKIAITRNHRTEDAHQRDSLAAALIAYSSYRNKFAKIDSLGMDPAKADEVKHLFVRGYSIDKARALIEERSRKPEAKKEAFIEKPKPAPQPVPESEYSKRMVMLERQNEFLRTSIAQKDSEISALKAKAAKIRRECDLGLRRDFEMAKKDHSIKNLKHNLFDQRRKAAGVDGLKKRWEMVLEGMIAPVGLFPAQKKGYVLLKRSLRKEEVESILSAAMVFTDDKANRLLLDEKNIPWADTALVREFQGCLYARLAEVEKAALDYRSRVRLEDIVEGYRKERS